MEERVVKTWLDIAPAYVNFLLKFLRNPREAFAKVAGATEVSSDLTSILLGGIAFAYLIVAGTASPELRNDPGRVAGVLRQLDYRVLPAVVLIATLAIAVVTHGLGKLYALFDAIGTRRKGKRQTSAKLGGSVEASVNAALGFVAVYTPLVSAAVCGIGWFSSVRPILVAVVGGLLALFALVYFPCSLSATHPRTGFWQAFLAFAGAIVLASIPLMLWE